MTSIFWRTSKDSGNKTARNGRHNPHSSDAHPQPRFFRTLSWRLLFVFFSLVSAVLLGMILVVAILLRNQLTYEIDQRLTSSGRVFAIQTLDQLLSQDGRQSEAMQVPSDFYFYIALDNTDPIRDVQDEVRSRYGEPQDVEALASIVNPVPTTVDSTRADESWRVITIPLRDSSSGIDVGTVTIGLPLHNVNLSVEVLVRMMVGISLGIVTLGGMIAYFLVQRSLRGLRAIETVTHKVAAGDLSQRVCASDDDSEVGMLGMSVNQMLQQIEYAFEVQQASEQRMRQFVSDASHELRTPLATVKGYAELYRLGGVPDTEVGHAFGRIESEASRMSNLVNDLLQLARLDEGQKLNLGRVELEIVAINAMEDFEVRAPNYPIRVTNLMGDDVEPVHITGDQERITQVIANLLSNVRTHTPEGTPVEIALGLDPTDQTHAIIEIRDHGPGISASDRERIFERFFRSDTSRSRDSGGTGLGLAIVSAIVAVHGGTTGVHETPGGGLTVRLCFPTGGPASKA
ncbi:MAG: HAMP domain-containing sensor histidine kinase [Actinomycetaceae bacterium]|nr:HAMP domain-containing histidine kinase [Arcanobacterium sp.]MDD7504884.1 HAMP domain-containing sensor histidine kinase [Actinomycetaceae bacterium]MDY6142720.1 HAMP domain-containing sensor histidine kinase [Arcanobacterium sp.]